MSETQYYRHMFLGAVRLYDEAEGALFSVLDPNEYVRVVDRDGVSATARVGQLEPIIMQDPTPSGVSGEEVEIAFTHKVRISDVLENLVSELRADELVEFIKILDERAQDWYVTEKLFEYFDDQHRQFVEIEGELND